MNCTVRIASPLHSYTAGAAAVAARGATLAEVLGVTIDRVSIKGKTNEGLGEIGRGEAIAVHAIALVRST